MYEIDPDCPKEQMEEYLRRNLLHASAVGAEAGARTALERLVKLKYPPKWLIKHLEEILDRCKKVSPEMAAHRDEISVYRLKPSQINQEVVKYARKLSW
jgi:hypothetical protein